MIWYIYLNIVSINRSSWTWGIFDRAFNQISKYYPSSNWGVQYDNLRISSIFQARLYLQQPGNMLYIMQ